MGDLTDLEADLIPPNRQIPYDTVYRLKDQLLAKASENYLSDIEIYEYIEEDALYMKPYLTYITLCKLYGDDDWHSFRPEHRDYSEELYDSLFRDYSRIILQAACAQAIAEDQIRRFKDYINSQGLILIGDMPLYLSYNSSEVWSNQRLFQLDPSGRRLAVAGVPPDAYAAEGQLWGNPLYRWDVMAADGFALFRHRLKHALGYLDRLRLDHFIGYVNYWSVPCEPDPAGGEPALPPDARSGSWVRALPEEFFALVRDSFPPGAFIAEDLGILNADVCSIRDGNGFPGMIILQFCFEESVPRVGEYPPERILYTGTHDNPTTLERYQNLEPDSPARANLASFIHEHPALFSGLGLEDAADLADSIPRVLVSIALASGCDNLIFPLQDLLGLDSTARMNIPGTALGNWQWRLASFDRLKDALRLT